MDSTRKMTENPLDDDDLDQQFDLLLRRVGELLGDESQPVSPKAVAEIVDEITQRRHESRIRFSRAIEDFITSWQPRDSTLRLRCSILAGLGLLNSTTERGVKSITRRIGDFLQSTHSDWTRTDQLRIVDAIARFYREYPNDFEFRYLDELFRLCEPMSFQMLGSLAPIMLGLNPRALGRLKLNDVVDTLFAAKDLDTVSDAEKQRVVSDIVLALPTEYWSQNLYKLDDPHNKVPHALKNRLLFLRLFLLCEPPLLAIFSVEDRTYIVRPSDLVSVHEEGKSVREAIKSSAVCLREPTQVGSFSEIDTEYQNLLGCAMEQSYAWQRRALTTNVISFADHQHKNREGS